MEDFIKGFNASFKSNKNNTQAISTTSEQYRGFDSKDYIFWGVFKGGTTGISREVYESDNATKPTSTIDESKVANFVLLLQNMIAFGFKCRNFNGTKLYVCWMYFTF